MKVGRDIDPLSPFVSTVGARLRVTVAELLGLGRRAALRVAVTRDATLAIRATLELAGGAKLELRVAEADADAAAWRKGVCLTLDYNRGLGAGRHPDARTDAVLSHVAEAFMAREATLADAVLDAARRAKSFDGVQDWMYRQVSASTDKLIGNLRLGFRCSQDCDFCWQDRTWPEPPASYYERWLDEMGEAGIQTCTITGGEPTLNRDLATLIARATQRWKMRVELQTNAIQCRRAAYTERLRDSGLTLAFVSLHSHDPDISNAMTRAPGTHHRTIEGITQLLAYGIDVHLNCVIDRRNAATLGDYARFVVARFVRDREHPVREVTLSNPASYYDEATYAEQMVDLATLRPHLVTAVAQLRDAGVRVIVTGTCGFPPCLFDARPELLGDAPGPAQVLEWDTRSRAFVEPCERCAVRPRCLGLRRGYAERFGASGVRAFEQDPFSGAD